MRDDPMDVLTIPQLLCMVIFALCLLPIAMMLAVVRDWNVPTNRVSCTNCGYRMVEIETSCPECRANQQRIK